MEYGEPAHQVSELCQLSSLPAAAESDCLCSLTNTCVIKLAEVCWSGGLKHAVARAFSTCMSSEHKGCAPGLLPLLSACRLTLADFLSDLRGRPFFRRRDHFSFVRDTIARVSPDARLTFHFI